MLEVGQGEVYGFCLGEECALDVGLGDALGTREVHQVQLGLELGVGGEAAPVDGDCEDAVGTGGALV